MVVVVRLLVPLCALTAAALLTWLDKHLWVPAFAMAAVTTLATNLTSFGKERGKQVLADLTADRKSRRALTIGPGGRHVRLKDVDPLRLGLHRPSPTGETPVASLQSYVRRDLHEELAAAIKGGGFVLIQGDSAAGKTRLAYEAAREAVPSWYVVRPTTVEALNQLATVRLHHTLIWLENLETYLVPGGLTVDLLDRLVPHGHSVTVLATMRLAARDAIVQADDGTNDRRLAASSQDVLTVGDASGLPRLSQTLSANERHYAKRAGVADARIAEALENEAEYGFVPWLAGGPAALSRWNDGQAGPHKLGAALITAAIDLRRAGYSSPISTIVLAELSKNYLSVNYANRADAPEIGTEVSWATTTERGTEPCLTLLRDNRVRVFDYLVDHVQRHWTRYSPIPDAIWNKALALASIEQNFSIGVAAYRHDQLERAHVAFAAGAEAGNADCLLGLGYVLSKTSGREAEAEAAYIRAIDKGHTEGLNNLGLLLSRQPGRESEAEDVYRRAISAGHTEALNNLGLLLSNQPGRERDAEEAYRDAIAAGHTKTLRNLGLLLSRQPTRQSEAEDAYRKAISAGHTEALSNLALLANGSEGEAGAVSLATVRVYLTDEHSHDNVESALHEVLETFGLDIVYPFDPEIGSWFRQIAIRARRNQVQEHVAAMERALVTRTSAQIEVSQQDAVAKLIATLEGVQSAVIQVGSLILVKVDDALVIRNLTPAELANFERHPEYFRDPSTALEQLRGLAGELEPSE